MKQGLTWRIGIGRRLNGRQLNKYVCYHWEEEDKAHLVNSVPLLKLPYFDCGSRDQYMLHFGTRLLARKLTALGIIVQASRSAVKQRKPESRLKRYQDTFAVQERLY